MCRLRSEVLKPILKLLPLFGRHALAKVLAEPLPYLATPLGKLFGTEERKAQEKTNGEREPAGSGEIYPSHTFILPTQGSRFKRKRENRR